MPARGYSPPSTDPVGRWALHLHANRKRLDWNQTKAFEEWRVGLRLSSKSRTSYLNLDSGKRQPKPHEAEYLIGEIGEPPDVPEPEPADEPTLTSALLALADELRETRRERQDLAAQVVALRGVVSLLAKRSGVALPAQLAPPSAVG